MLLSCLVPARGRFFRSWCLRAGVGALLRLHGRWSWLPSPGIVSGRCSVRRPPRCHVCRWHVGHLCLFPELHRRVRRPTRVPCGGVCTTRGCDTPATRRQRASCSAKPPSHQIGDRAGRNSRRRRWGVRGIVWARLLTKVPPHQVASSPSGLLPKASPRPPLHKFRMQFPDGANRRKLKNRGISTIRLQNLKHSQGNCMRNCWTPRCLPPEKLHVIPPGPHSTTARKPRNFNDPISIFETSSGELRAKLLCPSAAGPGHTRTKSRPIGEAAAMPAGNMGMAAEPVRGGRARVRLKINHAEQSSRRGRRAGRLRGGRRLGGLPRGTAHPDR